MDSPSRIFGGEGRLGPLPIQGRLRAWGCPSGAPPELSRHHSPIPLLTLDHLLSFVKPEIKVTRSADLSKKFMQADAAICSRLSEMAVKPAKPATI